MARHRHRHRQGSVGCAWSVAMGSTISGTSGSKREHAPKGATTRGLTLCLVRRRRRGGGGGHPGPNPQPVSDLRHGILRASAPTRHTKMDPTVRRHTVTVLQNMFDTVASHHSTKVVRSKVPSTRVVHYCSFYLTNRIRSSADDAFSFSYL